MVICIVDGFVELGIGIIILILLVGNVLVMVWVRWLFICNCDLYIEMLFMMEFGCVRYIYLNV